MGRNEIRIRRNQMSAGRIARHRNYGDLMLRHERDLKIKRFMKLFIYFLLAAFLVIIFLIVSRWEKKKEVQGTRDESRYEVRGTKYEVRGTKYEVRGTRKVRARILRSPL